MSKTTSKGKAKRSAPRTVTLTAMKVAHAGDRDVATASKGMRAKIRRLRATNEDLAKFLDDAGHTAKAPYPDKWPIAVARIIVPTVGKRS